MKRFLSLFLISGAFTLQAADQVTITLKNNTTLPHSKEMVEVDASVLRQKLSSEDFIITDANGEEVPIQVTHNGKVIFLADVDCKAKATFYAKAGVPQNYEQKAKGRLFHERGTEFGWENDCVAFRIYGDGAAVGYDLFNKSTTELMLDYWYASEQNQEMRSVIKQLHNSGYGDLADQVYNAFCYHIDHGKGMDCYTVGPTLGCGGDALVNPDGSLCLPKCYQKYEILDNGPLRFTVRLSYPEIEYSGKTVKETRIISLDAGSQFCRVTVTFDGLESATPLASGLVIHKNNPEAYVMDNAFLGYEDLGDANTYNPNYREELAKTMGKIYVGTLYPQPVKSYEFQAREAGIATGHVVGMTTLEAQGSYTYYFGTAWSGNKELGINSLSLWKEHLAQRSAQLKNPLKISIK